VLFALLLVCLVLFVVLPFLHFALWALFTTLLFGLVLGAVARVIAPGSGRIGCLTTSLIGVLGALLGNIASEALKTGWLARVLLEVAAAVILVLIVRPHPEVRQ
jgi:uncharacterized membrane protein YeaQ/YmgE (transglycosylase-associated protein family)